MSVIGSALGSIGRKAFEFLAHIVRMGHLVFQALYWVFVGPLKGRGIRWGSTFEQMVRMGVDSIPIVTVICFFVGLILAMQAAYQLEQFGATIYVADLVGVSMTREMGPMLTAIIVTGRSGSAIAAEIGTMKVAEEIDALRTMGFNPIRFLVVPRVLALLVVIPCLTLLADLVGILGGVFIAVTALKLSAHQYFYHTAEALVMKDLVTGLIKSVSFGLIVAVVGCYQGFGVSGGAEGVGRSTTASVVSSIFLIIVADLVFTALFYSTL
jgi:phospholipid/cholesterol/gamma-HCH transport system permease protein